MKALVAAALLLVAFGTMPASARPNDGSMWSNWDESSVVTAPGQRKKKKTAQRRAQSESYSYNSGYSGGVGPRPGRWCGWWMRTQKGGGPHLNLAWNWSKWGSPTGPQVGAVVVWRHHVGIITGRAANGQWIVKSGNDGGRVRERARSVSGAVFRI